METPQAGNSPTERLNALEVLVKSQGWDLLVDIIDRQIMFRQNRVMGTPVKDSSDSYRQEFEKGEAVGMKMLTKLPVSLMESLREDLMEKEPQNGNE